MQIQTTFTKFIGIESKSHISNKSNTLRSNKSSEIFSYIGTILAIQFV